MTGHLPYPKKEQNMILFLVGSGRLKLNVDDARSDTPVAMKDLIKICSEYDRDKRLNFVQVISYFNCINIFFFRKLILLTLNKINNVLATIQLDKKSQKKSILKRALSCPSFSWTQTNDFLQNLSDQFIFEVKPPYFSNLFEKI